ncbi:glycosyltransferase family 2 protein [Ensifer canadensis]|uniref:glycosyltransferase family 2 protein n=1 Tax=Ensifer canadensis TaxID=555315 RepID=UPI0035E3D6BD
MLNVIAQNELVADADEQGLWLAEGDDPYFLIRFSPLRERYVVIKLASRSGEIQPKLYVNRGRGFREEEALTAGSGRNFLIVADVGSFGTICTLRLDPASEPCQLTLEVRAIRSAIALQHFISDQQRQNSELIVARFSRLPRFWKKLPTIRLGRRKTVAARYVEQARILSDKLLPGQLGCTDPWLSIVVPVYNAPVRYLNELVSSFEQQNIEGVELVLSDDGSDSSDTLGWFTSRPAKPNVVLVANPINKGIALATNSGIGAARGEWVALLDHDDVIAPNGLTVIQTAIATHPDAEFFYTDELVVNDALEPIGLMLKPAYDPVLLTGVNYINHFSVYRRQRLNEIGKLRSGFEGSQDYDLLLRYLEGLDDAMIIHVPYPAYWWRQTGTTYSSKFIDRATDNARAALKDKFARAGKATEVTEALTTTLHRIRFGTSATNRPKISIIIPNKDSYALMATLLKGIYEQTTYDNHEVIVIDNGSTEPATLALYNEYGQRFPSFSCHIKQATFNFSRAINEGMERASGEHFLLLNNDVEIIDGGWLDELVDCLSYDHVGIVGAKLLYPDRRLQHAGVITGFGGLAGHWYLNKPEDFGGPMNRLHVRNSMTCVTGAVMLISGECARQIGQWDEENFAVAYNDVDYCLRAHKAGFRIVWTPFACLIHHESVSRGSDRGGENSKRFEREQENLKRLHLTHTFDDPASNPGYSTDRSDPKITPFSSLPVPRRWFT